ncbi:lipoprotein-releasing system ATP-binding protein LolD [Ruminiclostridium hungatei]|uniref:Lipoprotein-releasing system ATP-binding protein LolD n=1 Tax=Ruminiclostridium hungatei TaxID=48256 RepID=A0A1V4SSM2_RUMHU|nr:ABC transporter ATP-binding protein [Ruminiclostridium hungatei]OPX46301.1 lipoprotein-releasing system ATP-binding protein LolD [Ruminiclostridium hungatei]
MNKILNVNNLCKTYIVNKRQNNVLRNVNFEMNQGEFISIMGPSGSGKSTLLYTVSGMDRLTAGRVIFCGRDISSLSPDKMSELRLNEMGFIFQQMHMLRNLSAYDNIIVSAYSSAAGKTGQQRKIINEYAEELMRKLDIIDIANNDITEVSGGQLQRACICRALINRPKMIFADEPTGALNSKASNEVMSQLNKINREGTSILLVTHDVKVAAKTDKVLYIVDGNIQGELLLGKYSDVNTHKERERKLNGWLMDMGW